MRGREMLDTIENLNPAYIEAAAEKPKEKKGGWLKWGAIAACFCLLIAAVAVAPHLLPGTTPVPPDNNDFPVQTTPNKSEGSEHTEGPWNP